MKIKMKIKMVKLVYNNFVIYFINLQKVLNKKGSDQPKNYFKIFKQQIKQIKSKMIFS